MEASLALIIRLPDQAGLAPGDSLRVTLYGTDLMDAAACPYHDVLIPIPASALEAGSVRYESDFPVRSGLRNYFAVTGIRDSSGTRLRILDENTSPVGWRPGQTEYRVDGLIAVHGEDRKIL